MADQHKPDPKKEILKELAVSSLKSSTHNWANFDKLETLHTRTGQISQASNKVIRDCHQIDTELYHTAEQACLDGWYRKDEVGFCKEGKDKPFLKTRLVNYDKRLVMHDLYRHIGTDITQVVKALPVDDDVKSGLICAVELPPNTIEFKRLFDNDPEAWELSVALNALNYKPGCPHCGANFTFHCNNCETITCDEFYADYDVECVSCGKQTPRQNLAFLKYGIPRE